MYTQKKNGNTNSREKESECDCVVIKRGDIFMQI